jgi:ubiquinone/menaquinone biosynthesis C-methylase UbiE
MGITGELKMSEKRFSGEGGKDYDLTYNTVFGPAKMAERALGEVLTKHFDKRVEGRFRVLDLGCGTGITSEVALNADPRIYVDAIDNEEVMVRQCRSKLSKHILAGRANVHLIDAVNSQRCLIGEYDAVISGFMIHNLPKNERSLVVNAAYCLLGEGGIFVNADKIAHDKQREHAKHFAWQMNQFKKFDKIERQDLRKYWEDHYERDNKDDLKLTEREFEDTLTVMGFSSIEKVFRRHTEAVYTARVLR